ncbi:alpha/beta fold hydrolase [Flavisolibacter nicotianae]|uniref:alpha/beta fold hydrolase n=1 Tax=Flavisolibacter nicotianae TaxID=2364882 RepID=UPI000EADC31B|nr:alpha/beta fold hydrolase [Flavisolibacter nicotianae]
MKKLFFLLTCFLALAASAQITYPDSQTDGKYITVNGARLWVVTVGKGDPLILISGGPGGAHVGLRRFDTLASHYMLIYFDAFGRGKSDTAKNVKDYTIERDIEDIEGLRTALHLDKINVLGHSYGGVVAQGYAVKYPQHVKHLVLANTFHSFVMWQENDDNSNHEIKTNYPEVWDSLTRIREKGAVSSDALHQEIYGQVPYGFLYAYNPDNFRSRGAKPYPNAMNTKLYYQMVGKDGDFIVGNDIGNFDFRQQLKNLPMPVLIYGGRYDRVAVPRMMVKYKDYCPQARFVMFEHSGHNPQVEEPQALFALLNNFLGR